MTGQVSTGQKVAASAAHGMKYVTMELGGKSPLLVLPDCDLDIAVDGAMMASKSFRSLSRDVFADIVRFLLIWTSVYKRHKSLYTQVQGV